MDAYEVPRFILCPDCNTKYDDAGRRRVIDSCGHPRCFSCLCNNGLCPQCNRAKIAATGDSDAVASEPGGYLEWRGRSPSTPPSIVARESYRRHRSRSLVQLHNSATYIQRSARDKAEGINSFWPTGQRSGTFSSSVSSSCEKLQGNAGVDTTTTTRGNDPTRVDRKMSFSSILNRNSQSYKQSRFKRASSFSVMPKEGGSKSPTDATPFESRIRIPNRQRPLSLNSYELERLNLSSHLPSPSEEVEALNGTEVKSSKFEAVVEKAAAWLEESKSVMSRQCLPAPAGASRTTEDTADCEAEEVADAVVAQIEAATEYSSEGDDSSSDDSSDYDGDQNNQAECIQGHSTFRQLDSTHPIDLVEINEVLDPDVIEDGNIPYILDLRALLHGLNTKKPCLPIEDERARRESRESDFRRDKTDACCQFNGRSGTPSPRIVSPRRNGTCTNPFRQMVQEGGVKSSEEVFESNEPQSITFGRKVTGKDIGEPRSRVISTDQKPDNQNESDHTPRWTKRHGERHEPEEGEKEGENKTATWEKKQEQDARPVVERAPVSYQLGKLISGKTVRNSRRNASLKENAEQTDFTDSTGDEVFSLSIETAKRQPKYQRASKSSSEVEVRIAEVQYFSAFKRNRRRRTTSSSSSLLKWNADLISNELDVDSFNNNASMKVEDRFENEELILAETTVGSSNATTTTKEVGMSGGHISFESTETVPQGDAGDKEVDRNALTESDQAGSGTQSTLNCAKEALQCFEIPITANVSGEEAGIDNRTDASLGPTNASDGMSSSADNISGDWKESKCCVEAMLKNKTDDWKTANFHKIHGDAPGSEGCNGDGLTTAKVKEDGPIVFVDQEDLGPWFKEKRKSREQLQGSDSRRTHSHPKTSESTSPSNGIYNLGFIRGKLQKLAKWSRRHSDMSSNSQRDKDKGLEKSVERRTKKTNSDNSSKKKSQNFSLHDYNRNFVLSSEFVRSSRKKRSQMKHDSNKPNPPLVVQNGSVNSEVVKVNDFHLTGPVARGSSHLNADDQTSLTTVSALSAKQQGSISEQESTITLTASDSSDDTDHSDSTVSGPLMFSSSSSSDTINESVEKTEMPDFRSPSRIQEDLAVLLERKVTRKRQGIEEIDFHPLMPTTKGKALVSRDWLYDRVYHWTLETRTSKSRVLLVSGNHGCGKTTFLKSIVWSDCSGRRKNRVRESLSGSVLSYHFCSQADTRTTSPSAFVLNMAACLIENRDMASFTKALSEDSKLKDHINAGAAQRSPEMAFRRGILEPLNAIYPSPAEAKCKSAKSCKVPKQFLILVDALEHQCTNCSPDQCVTALLANNIQFLPSWISLVVTGSKDSLDVFRNRGAVEIYLDNVANWDIQSDLYSFVEMELPVMASEGASKAKIRRLVDNVVRFSRGSFQTAHMAIQYLSSSFASAAHQPNLQALDGVKLVSHLFKLKFAVPERNRILALSLLDVLLVSKELPTLSSLYKVVECSCSSQQVPFQEYKSCLEKLLELQMIAESAEGKLFLTNISSMWLRSSDGTKVGSSPSKGHNLLSVYYMKTLTSSEGRQVFLLAYHLALSSFGEDIEDPENKVRFLAWTFAQVFKDSSAGFTEVCNVYRPIPEVYHLFLHTELDFQLFEKKYNAHPIVLASSLQQSAIVALLLDHQLFSKAHLQEALKAATRVGNTEIIELLLKVKARIPLLKCESTDGGIAFLEIALEKNHLSAAIRLLELIWQDDEDGEVKRHVSQRILTKACQAGKVDIVDELIQKGIDASSPDSLGNVPLVLAASRNNLVVAKRLVENGANVDTIDVNGLTPLISSAMHGHVETSEWLISQDANVDAEDREGKTALLYAAAHNLSQLVHSLFMEGASLNHQDKEGLSALAAACKGSCPEAVKVLLKNRAMTEMADNENRTALHYACAKGNLRIVQLLLDGGADLGHKDLRGLKPLEYALTERQLDAVVLLLKYGAHVGRTARNLAMRNIDSFLCLISHLEQRGNIMIRAGKYVEANECFQRAINMIEVSQFRNNKRVQRVKLLCEQDSRKKFI